jgi:hypothetical protein
MRAACAQEFEAHWQCLELNNQVSLLGATHAPLTKTGTITETICLQEARAATQRVHVYQAGLCLCAFSTLEY